MVSCVVVLLSLSGVNAQSFNIGVRAGLNSTKFIGPVEEGENYKFSSGFHFGLSYQYNFVDNFGLRAELEYTQIGGVKEYTGPSYFIIRNGSDVIFEPGTLMGPGELNLRTDEVLGEDAPPGYLLEVSNAYLNIPITAHVKLGRKIELLAGAYLGFNINPTANGSLRFDSSENIDDIFFEQSLNYRYYQDEALGFIGSPGSTTVYVNDEPVNIPRVASAYYQQAIKENSTYRVFDLGLIAGANYYINKGFYFGGRVNYGLLDVTRSEMDFSFTDYDAVSKTQTTRDDKDLNLSLEFSLGFKF